MNFLYQFERGPHAPSAPPAISATVKALSMFLLNMSLEISNIYSVLLYSYYTDIYFDISCEGGGGGGGVVFIFRLIASGIMKICMDLGGGYKKTSR